MVEMKSVDSSNINGVGYDERLKKLYIAFSSGTYMYHDVPKEVYEDLMSAPSKGKFVHKSIRGTYDYSKPNK